MYMHQRQDCAKGTYDTDATLPERPWWRITMDFCTLEEKNGEEYLVVCDYYSRYMIAKRFESATAQSLC